MIVKKNLVDRALAILKRGKRESRESPPDPTHMPWACFPGMTLYNDGREYTYRVRVRDSIDPYLWADEDSRSISEPDLMSCLACAAKAVAGSPNRSMMPGVLIEKNFYDRDSGNILVAAYANPHELFHAVVRDFYASFDQEIALMQWYNESRHFLSVLLSCYELKDSGRSQSGKIITMCEHKFLAHYWWRVAEIVAQSTRQCNKPHLMI